MTHPVLTGVVLDTAAVLGWVRRAPYIQTMTWTTAVAGGSVLIPATVLAAAAADIKPADHDLLAVLLGHPNTLVPALDQAVAGQLGALLAARRVRDSDPDALISAAHAVAESTGRDWPVLTDRPAILAGIDPEVRFDTLP